MAKRKMNSKKNEKIIVPNANDPLFQFIKPRDNNSFSKMDGCDLQDLLYYIDHYYLELRNRLGFDNSVTFGLELEFENAMEERIKNRLNGISLSQVWQYKHDGSLYNGGEINSPVLTDSVNSWKELKSICSIVSEFANIDKNCGGHIHIGTQVLGNKKESWLNFIKLWSVYENIIYRFVYGDFLTARSSMQNYARPISKKLWDNYMMLREYNQLEWYDIVEKIQHERYQAINFRNIEKSASFKTKNTIEFRCPNGTLESTIWQNNVNLFVNLLNYSKSSRYNDDIVSERRNINGEKYTELLWYDEIYLQQALELCDMVFTNNLDKVYFLRQYLKSFQIRNQKLDKLKSFIKK